MPVKCSPPLPCDQIPACLDVSCDDNYCAVGTDANREDVFIPIWEARNPERPLVNLGEAHSDDITQVGLGLGLCPPFFTFLFGTVES